MKIEHVALYLQDLGGGGDFFTKYGISNEGCHNGRTDFRACFLRLEDGSRLELMTRPGLSAGGQNRRGDTHLAFSVGSGEGIDRLTERLRQNGFQVLSGPRTTGDGYYESCVAGFEGNLIEITI